MTVNAETLLWYRFGGSGNVITNVANPGVMDGTLKGVSAWGSSYKLQGEYTPERVDLPADWVKTGDPKADVQYASEKALSWTGDKNHTGVVDVPAADVAPELKAMKSFTYEAFVKISEDAMFRATNAIATSGQTYAGPTMFPIVHWEQDNTDGVMFSLIYSSGKIAPFVRIVVQQPDGTSRANVSLYADSGMKTMSYDEWHHVALTVNDNGDDTARMVLYVDYVQMSSVAVANYAGIHFSDGGKDFMIGANAYNTGRCFLGDIAEVRISDTALAENEMLRPVPAGPVDEDTLLYLPLGDTPWFAPFSGRSDAPTNDTAIGLNDPLNGAPTLKYSPSWYRTGVAYPGKGCGIPVITNETYGTELLDGCLGKTVYEDANSILFSHKWAMSGENGYNYGHVLKIPYAGDSANIAQGDFTVEWFYRTSAPMGSAAATNSYTMLYCPWAKIMMNRDGRALKTRLGDIGAVIFTDIDYGGSANPADDGNWHHYALVYDSVAKTAWIWLDYVCVTAMAIPENKPLVDQSSVYFIFGGESYHSQVFCGNLDDLRITKRMLRVDEFLTTHAVSEAASAADATMYVRMEGDLSTGTDYAGSGVIKTFPGDAVTDATYVDHSRKIDYDNDGTADAVSGKALALDGACYLTFSVSPLGDCRDFTLEFFARVESLGAYANLFRFYRGSDAMSSSTILGLFRADNAWYVKVMTATNGLYDASSIEYDQKELVSDRDLMSGIERWHHYAAVVSTDRAATNTTFRLYRDYVEVGSCTFDNLLAFSPAKDAMAFGVCSSPSSSGAGTVKGMYDEIRLRPGVQPVGSFMRCIPSGLTVILR